MQESGQKAGNVGLLPQRGEHRVHGRHDQHRQNQSVRVEANGYPPASDLAKPLGQRVVANSGW